MKGAANAVPFFLYLCTQYRQYRYEDWSLLYAAE